MRVQIQRVAPSGQSSLQVLSKSDPSFERGWHCHPECELTAILESRGRRLVGESLESYADGDLVLLGPDLPHSWRSDEVPGLGEHRAIVVHFRRDFLGEAFWDRPEMREISRLLERSRRGLQFTGATRDRVIERLVAMADLEALDRLIALLEILGDLSRAGGEERALCHGHEVRSPGPRTRERFDRVFDYLHENYAGAISQAEIASRLSMSPSSFSRFFRQTTGKTFLEYLAQLRLARACELLRDTDLSILEVSLRAGYNNLSNFNRAFRRHHGLTPREYRRGR